MPRLSFIQGVAAAIVLSCTIASNTGFAANGVFYPIANRYEPYATFYMKNALAASRQMILNGDFSTDALMACYYATLSSAEFNDLWADGLLKYVTYGSTYDQYLQTVATAGGHAYLASQYAYKAYLANPNGYSQTATGWSYYGASAAYMAYLSPAPGQFMYDQGAPDVFNMRVVAYYSGRYGTFLKQNELGLAAFLHAVYMANNDSVSEQEVVNGNTLDTPAVIASHSSFVPLPGTNIGVVVLKLPASTQFPKSDMLSQFYTPVPGSSIGIGQATKNGFTYYCVYVATKAP